MADKIVVLIVAFLAVAIGLLSWILCKFNDWILGLSMRVIKLESKVSEIAGGDNDR